jgi:UDP-N-acetylglucosamine 3-dehydrogenase
MASKKPNIILDVIEASGADALAAQEGIKAAIRSHQTGGMPIDVPVIG